MNYSEITDSKKYPGAIFPNIGMVKGVKLTSPFGEEEDANKYETIVRKRNMNDGKYYLLHISNTSSRGEFWTTQQMVTEIYRYLVAGNIDPSNSWFVLDDNQQDESERILGKILN